MFDVRMTLARNIREARRKRGLLQEDLAEVIGASASETISQIELGKREVKAWELSRIARKLNVEFRDLLSPEGPEFGPAALWRKQAAANRGEIESLLRLRSQRYHHVMRLTDTCPDEQLPFMDEYDVAATTYEQLEEWALAMGRQMELGAHPADSLFEVLENRYCVMVFFQDLGDESSAITVLGPYGPAMLLNSREPPWRRNFSCAHELFHLLTWNAVPREELPKDQQLFSDVETHANVFASALLLPRDSLSRALQQRAEEGQIQIVQLIEIARRFGVSTSALLYRLSNLGLVPKGTPNDLLDNALFKQADRRTMAAHWSTPLDLPKRFVELAFVAHMQDKMSRARLAEILETDLAHLPEVLAQYGLDTEFDVVYKAALSDA